jgi:hypothetical protein
MYATAIRPMLEWSETLMGKRRLPRPPVTFPPVPKDLLSEV